MRVTGGLGLGRHHIQDCGEDQITMKGKPFLVAVAAFVIVLFGGVAVAGVGSMNSSSDTAGTIADVEFAAASDEAKAEAEAKEKAKAEEAEKAKAEAEAKEEAKAEEAEKAAAEAKAKEKAKAEAAEKAAAEAKAKEKAEAEAAEKAKAKEKAEAAERAKEEAEEKDKDDDKSDAQKDLFTIKSPSDGTHVENKVVRFSGEAADGVTIHRGKYTAEAKNGTWSMELVLSPGKNKVAFEAKDGQGHFDSAVVTVYYDAPKEEEDPKEDDEPKDVKFTANQKYGSCGEEVPYDVFWGTAKPGAKIEASSPYGSNSTTANDKGHWELKVKFPDAPVGETFKVKINSSDGGYQKFHFTNTGSGKDH